MLTKKLHGSTQRDSPRQRRGLRQMSTPHETAAAQWKQLWSKKQKIGKAKNIKNKKPQRNNKNNKNTKQQKSGKHAYTTNLHYKGKASQPKMRTTGEMTYTINTKKLSE